MSGKGAELGGVPTGEEPKLTVRIVHQCEFRCPACSTFSGPTGCGRLALDDFTAAVDDLAGAGFTGILNISGGETTLHPDLEAMLAYASAKLPGSRIAVFTHGHWVGREGWQRRLEGMLAGDNVLVRFSLDRQHAEGIALSKHGSTEESIVGKVEKDRLEKARGFHQACLAAGARPAENFDFAFKGTFEEGRAYTSELGEVPLYLITFRPDPQRRPKTPGFFALDIDEGGQPVVYRTLGHIPLREPDGGLEALIPALEWNRSALRDKSSR